MKRWLSVRLLLLFSSLMISRPSPAGAASQSAPILFLSGQNGTPRATETIAAFTEAWDKAEPGVRVLSQFLAVFSFPPTKASFEAMHASLAVRLRDGPPRLIVAHGDLAMDMAVKLRETAFSECALVGIELTPTKAAEYAGLEKARILPFVDFERYIIDLAREVLPGLKTLYLLINYAPEPNAEEQASRRLRETFPDLDFVAIADATPSRADAALKGVGADAAALCFSPGWIDETGRFVTGDAFIRQLTGRYDLPFFGLIRDDLEAGLAGGYGLAMADWGTAAAKLGLELVNGTEEAVPRITTESLAHPFLNYAVLSRFGVKLHELPPDVELINRPTTFWIRYQTQIQIAIFIMALLLIALVVSFVIHRRIDGVLRWANEKLERQVAERTQALSVANEELTASNENLASALRRAEAIQETLIKSARESVLGRMATALANELNSPLNAIASANEASTRVLRDASTGINRLIGSFTDDQRALFERYAKIIGETPYEGLNQTYAAARKLEAALAAAGCPDASGLAANLTDSGIRALSPEELATFTDERAGPVTQALYELSVVYRSGYIITQAVHNAAASVAALRAYSNSMAVENDIHDFDLAASIERALSLFRDKLGTSCTVLKHLNGPAAFRGDEAAFIRVWTHLIQNALDAMPAGGSLSLGLDTQGRTFRVSVGDTGLGVAPEIKDRIFEAFVTTKPAEEGLGIGLAYCKRVVEGSGGTIDFETSEAGSVFTVILPSERNTA